MTAEPLEITRLRAKIRPGAMVSAPKKAAIRRRLAEWEAEQRAAGLPVNGDGESSHD